jgi:hypothetical protein
MALAHYSVPLTSDEDARWVAFAAYLLRQALDDVEHPQHCVAALTFLLERYEGSLWAGWFHVPPRLLERAVLKRVQRLRTNYRARWAIRGSAQPASAEVWQQVTEILQRHGLELPAQGGVRPASL